MGDILSCIQNSGSTNSSPRKLASNELLTTSIETALTPTENAIQVIIPILIVKPPEEIETPSTKLKLLESTFGSFESSPKLPMGMYNENMAFVHDQLTYERSDSIASKYSDLTVDDDETSLSDEYSIFSPSRVLKIQEQKQNL